eukprot:6205404-Pleurochrysis_carterae.AAC.1
MPDHRSERPDGSNNCRVGASQCTFSSGSKGDVRNAARTGALPKQKEKHGRRTIAASPPRHRVSAEFSINPLDQPPVRTADSTKNREETGSSVRS